MANAARRLRLMLLCLLAELAAVPAVNWIVNPYGAWRISIVEPVYRVPDPAATGADERVTTAYRIRVAEPTTVLVGSSRVLLGIPIEQNTHDGFFNASLSGASLAEIAAVVRLATANPRLKRVIWGVDFYAFDERFGGSLPPETRRRLEGDEWHLMPLRIKETLLSMQALEDSRRVLGRVIAGRERLPQPVPVPWPGPRIGAGLDDRSQPRLDGVDEDLLKLQLRAWVFNYSDYRLSGAQLSLLQNAVADARERGIEVILFVPPLSRCELEVIDQAGQWPTFQQWKRQLLAAGPYWDFSGYDKLDRADAFFLDVAHFKPAVGHVILGKLLGQRCEQCGAMAQTIRDAGVWVDTATVDAYLARQQALRATARQLGASCAKVVEDMLRAHGTHVASPPVEPSASTDGTAGG